MVDIGVVVVDVAVVTNGSRVLLVVASVVADEDGGGGADGRTRHGRTRSMEWNEKTSTAEMNFMLELWALSYCQPTFASSNIDVYSDKEGLRVNTAVNGQGQMSENREQYKRYTNRGRRRRDRWEQSTYFLRLQFIGATRINAVTND